MTDEPARPQQPAPSDQPLRMREDHLHRQSDLLNQVSDAIISTDMRFAIQSWNAAAAAMYGWSADEVIGQLMSEIVPTEYPDSSREQVRAIFLSEGRWQGEVIQRHRDGTQLSILSSVSTLRGEDGQPLGAVAVNHDITVRKRAAQALQQTNERLRILADASRTFAEIGADYRALLDEIAQMTTALLGEGCAIGLVSGDGAWLEFVAIHEVDRAILDVERALLSASPIPIEEGNLSLRMIRYGEPLFIPVVDADQISAATRPGYQALIDAIQMHSMIGVPLRVHRTTIGVLLAHRRLRHRPPFSEADLSLVQDLADRAALAISNARLLDRLQHELVERTRAESAVRSLSADLERRVAERTAALTAANQELEAFSYSVSHDLRAPLRAIDGFTRILIEDYAESLPDEAKRYFAMVRNNAQQMGRLIDDLLAFSRLSRQALRRDSVSSEDLVRECIETLRADDTGRPVEIIVGALPRVGADPSLLRQVWMNLIANALKYTRARPHARIEIGSHPDEGAVVFFIRDNGVGFDMRYSGKLFGVFQRLHRAEEYEGTGVGLAIVQRIIHRHGGRIWVEAAVDRGATFSFTLAGAEHAAP